MIIFSVPAALAAIQDGGEINVHVLLGKGCLFSFCIRERTYIGDGQMVDQQKQSMKFLIHDGWKQKTSSAGLKNRLFPQCSHFYRTGSVVLFIDSHYSHIDLNESKRERHIHILCLPPCTTHVPQPLDVGVYGPVKTS